MPALLSEVMVQWFMETIKGPAHSAVLCCALIKDKRSRETQNHTGRIDFHYHSQWHACLHTNTHTLKHASTQT